MPMLQWAAFWRVWRCRGSVSGNSTTKTHHSAATEWQSAFDQHPRMTWGMFFALVATIALGAGLRLLQLGARPATAGELDMIAAVTGSLGNIWRNAAQHQAPLAETLFWLGAQALGPSLMSLRLVSVIAATIMLPLFWLAAARAVGRGAALLATALLATAPASLAVSSQALPAALAVAALPLTFLCYEQLRRHQSMIGWTLFALAALFVTMCTYLGMALVLGQLAALVIVVERPRRVETILGGLICALLLVLAVSPLLARLLHGGIPISGTEMVQLTTMLAKALSVTTVVPSPLREAAVFAIAGALVFALMRSYYYRNLLPHLLQIAALALVLLAVASPLNSAENAAALALPSLLLIIVSGLSSLAEFRFGWLLATVLAAVLLTNHFVGLVSYFVAT